MPCSISVIYWLKNNPGQFRIRRPRGKAAVSLQPPSQGDELREFINEMSARVTEMEKQQSAREEETQRLVVRVDNLEVEMERLQGDVLRESINEMNARVTEMEKKQSAGEKETQRLVTRVPCRLRWNV